MPRRRRYAYEVAGQFGQRPAGQQPGTAATEQQAASVGGQAFTQATPQGPAGVTGTAGGPGAVPQAGLAPNARQQQAEGQREAARFQDTFQNLQ